MSATMENWLPRHRITADEYSRMVEGGVLAPDARVELIEGEIVDMPPIGSAHAATITFLLRVLNLAVGNEALVISQSPVRLGDYSEPQPDLALVRPRQDFYRGNHPAPEDTLLLIEVCETSLRYDRRVKVPLYARHGIPEVWIVDLQGKQLHIFVSPLGSEYQRVSSTESPGIRSPTTLPGIAVDLTEIMG